MLRKKLRENVLYHTDFDRLQRLFDEACEARGIDLASNDAPVLAAQVIALFQEGMKDEEIRQKLSSVASIDPLDELARTDQRSPFDSHRSPITASPDPFGLAIRPGD